MEKYSQTQLANIGIAAGVLVMLAGRLGYVIDEKSVAFVIAGLWSLGWTAYSWYQRWRKGDLSLGGWRVCTIPEGTPCTGKDGCPLCNRTSGKA